MIKRILGNNIKHMHFKRRLSQEQLAEALEISSTYLGYIENSKHNLSLDLIEKIALYFEVEINSLFIQNEYNFPKRIDSKV